MWIDKKFKLFLWPFFNPAAPVCNKNVTSCLTAIFHQIFIKYDHKMKSLSFYWVKIPDLDLFMKNLKSYEYFVIISCLIKFWKNPANPSRCENKCLRPFVTKILQLGAARLIILSKRNKFSKLTCHVNKSLSLMC